MKDQNKNVLFFDEPAHEWVEGLPIGNGKLGAMVWGGPAREVISLNHDSLRREKARSDLHPVSHRLPLLRSLCLQNKWEQAFDCLEDMVKTLGPWQTINEYQPVCDAVLKLESHCPTEGYGRSLDLSTGLVEVEHRIGKVKYTHTCFASAIHDLIIVHVTATTPGSVNCRILLQREPSDDCFLTAWTSEDMVVLDGLYDEGVRFAAAVRLVLKEGHVKERSPIYSGRGGYSWVHKKNPRPLASASIEEADELLMLVAVSTSDEVSDPVSTCLDKLKNAPADLETLRQSHVTTHRKIFDRVSLDLTSSAEETDTVTDRLVHKAYRGNPANHLFELLFQMGRYLLIASSRPGSKPANLQGIWNADMHPPWSADWHLDANIQMNYWLAEPCNLSECASPLFDFVEKLVPAAETNARNLYGCRGVLFPISTDLTGILQHRWVAWTGAAGWLAQHFWWHYEYTLDLEFLREHAYPFMKRVAAFYQDFLMKDDNGAYTFVPSISPENKPMGRDTFLSINATMDLAITKEVFANLVKASEELQVDFDLRPLWQEALDSLPEWPINKDGALKEWAEDAVDNDFHRHLSHLYPLFPGEAFTLENTPKLTEAARRALEARKSAGLSSHCGWTYPWLALLYARLGRGDKALEALSLLAKGFVLNNLLTVIGDWRSQGLSMDLGGVGYRLFQIDAGLGVSAAISEMLLQSHHSLVRILPALPDAWNSGRVEGLRARGAFQIDIRWLEGRIEQVTVNSLKGGLCHVKLCLDHDAVIVRCDGEEISHEETGTDQIMFLTHKGRSYELF